MVGSVLFFGLYAQTPPSPAAQAKPAPAAPASSEVKITARTQERMKDRVFAAGDVEVRSGDIVLFADRVEYDLESKDVVAEGNVVVQSGAEVIRAERILFNLESGRGTVEKASGMLPPSVLFEAETLERKQADFFSLKKGRITACTQPNPRWSFGVSRADIRTDDHVTMWDAVVRIKGVPVFYTPYMRYPLKDRATGFLMPRIGFGGEKGLSLSQGFFWAIAPNMDATVGLDLYSKRGTGAGLEYRYLFPGGTKGDLDLDYFVYKRDASGAKPASSSIIRINHTQAGYVEGDACALGYFAQLDILGNTSEDDKVEFSFETALFNELVSSLTPFIALIQADAAAVGRLDCLRSFATISAENGYKRPVLDDSHVLDIKDGRHPVIEKQLPPDEPYVPNDVWLDNDEQQVIILTGPNMSGKSALLRQTALIVILAQSGCFIPAREARIGIIDKIFTRVGASDNLSLGESTFMVEMNEAASILNNLSDRSLILLDEIGRGTSTYDGISIAWAMVEYIHENRHRAKTLFATHYHELNEMESTFARVKNYNVSIRELDNRVIFLRKLKRGGSEHSFGIHVARMAGMPRSVVGRADEILKMLEVGRGGHALGKPVEEIAVNREGYQLSIYQLDDPVLKQIRDELLGLDLDNLTPMEALNKLFEWKKKM
jgi:lipopolysaccharide export system protein LptA/energy-coupling factor transporter ATP-binding protein EcfA2